MAKRFSLEEARSLVPTVMEITRKAVEGAEPMRQQLEGDLEEDEEKATIMAQLVELIEKWSAEISELGCEPKGPWLVDFDSGNGYFCWQYGDEEIGHFHDYESGFGGRVPLQ